jgi:hypothetical protein
LFTTLSIRDEIIYTHSYIQAFFETIKGYSKKVSEVKEAYNVAVSTAAVNHRERRVFLRTAVKELVLICSDQPGLLGPKAGLAIKKPTQKTFKKTPKKTLHINVFLGVFGFF